MVRPSRRIPKFPAPVGGVTDHGRTARRRASQRLRAVGFYAPVDDAGLTRALGQLATWELLDVVQNHAGSYATAEEYERKNLQYSLTRKGEAAFAGVQHALAVLTTSGALQTAIGGCSWNPASRRRDG